MKTAKEFLIEKYAGKRDMDTEFVFYSSIPLAELLEEYAEQYKCGEDFIKKEELIKKKEIKFKSQVFLFIETYPEKMLEKFCNYWTEKNCRGKMRYEFEKTFEINRRLATWASRDKDLIKPVIPIIDNISYKELADRFNRGETAIWEQYEPITPGDKRTLWRRKQHTH